MDVIFNNESGSEIQIIVVFKDQSCSGGNDQQWHAMGWYTLEQNMPQTLFSTNSTTFYYYAEDTQGLGRRWGGTAKFVYIRRGEIINQCISIRPPGSETIGLFERDANLGLTDTFTETLSVNLPNFSEKKLA